MCNTKDPEACQGRRIVHRGYRSPIQLRRLRTGYTRLCNTIGPRVRNGVVARFSGAANHSNCDAGRSASCSFATQSAKECVDGAVSRIADVAGNFNCGAGGGVSAPAQRNQSNSTPRASSHALRRSQATFTDSGPDGVIDDFAVPPSPIPGQLPTPSGASNAYTRPTSKATRAPSLSPSHGHA